MMPTKIVEVVTKAEYMNKKIRQKNWVLIVQYALKAAKC